MVKFILDDYCCRFLTAVRENIGQAVSYIWIVVYIGIIWRVDFVKYSMGMIPMLFGLLLSRMYPNQLCKLLFLCPLSENDRKSYLKTAYNVRVGMPMVLWLVCAVPGTMKGMISLFYLAELSLLILSFLAGVNLYHVLLNTRIVLPGDNRDQRLSSAYSYSLMTILMQVTAYSAIIYFACGIREAGTYTDKIIFTVLTAVEMMLSGAAHKIYYHAVMDLGLGYENSRLDAVKHAEKYV